MANIIEGLKYTKEHEWARIEGDIVITGITDYAQSELSDIVMVDPPKIGTQIKAGDAIGTIEAVKAVTDLFAPVSGEVIEINERVIKEPGIINKDPYNEGWLYKIKMSNPAEVESLLSAEQYKELIAGR
ncbi:MAG: glycine cleavage system protein GcvH [candidate division WOR-3 bacterium]|nr:glycine cleavage system protein GcvH [candidate division WOR-3 bacterium]